MWAAGVRTGRNTARSRGERQLIGCNGNPLACPTEALNVMVPAARGLGMIGAASAMQHRPFATNNITP
eukprot:7033324-Lingulodinium_polyedra.AAC.1